MSEVSKKQALGCAEPLMLEGPFLLPWVERCSLDAGSVLFWHVSLAVLPSKLGCWLPSLPIVGKLGCNLRKKKQVPRSELNLLVGYNAGGLCHLLAWLAEHPRTLAEIIV